MAFWEELTNLKVLITPTIEWKVSLEVSFGLKIPAELIEEIYSKLKNTFLGLHKYFDIL